MFRTSGISIFTYLYFYEICKCIYLIKNIIDFLLSEAFNFTCKIVELSLRDLFVKLEKKKWGNWKVKCTSHICNKWIAQQIK